MPLALLLLPLLGAAVLPLVARRLGRDAVAWAAAVLDLAALALALGQVSAVFAGAGPALALPWIPRLGLHLALRLDGLALLFVLLVLGIGLLVILYARYYLPESDRLGRFYALLLLFQAAMLGIVLADNLLLLSLFWELTSLSSFLLIAYDPAAAEARRGARSALVVTAGGGLALLAGLLLLGHMAGTFQLSGVLAAAATVHAHPLYLPALLLVLLGAFTKSAQFPFHFWLPLAMAAPTPVSAYLHSATMVKAGVFLLARLFPVFAQTDDWFYLVGGTGLLTLLAAAYLALFQHDIKGLLAYSTISHLGLITLLFGLGTPLGAVAGVFHLINHAVFKASLFMAAGIIDHETGTRDMRRINGLWQFMPYTATLAIVAAAAMAGVPLLNGFLSKEMFFAETIHHQWLAPLDWLLPAAATLAGVFSVAYSARFIHDVFFNGAPHGLPREPHEPPHWMRLPVEVLVTLTLLVGVLPQQTVRPLLDLAVRDVLGGVPAYDLALWHGLTLPLAMSVAALVGGTLVYAVRHTLFTLHARPMPRGLAAAAFGWSLAAARRHSRRALACLDNGSLARYTAWLLATALLLGALPTLEGGLAAGPLPPTPLDGVSLAATLVLAAGAVGSALLHQRPVTALLLAGAVGLAVTLVFIRFSAPDLALTQLAVEVITTLLLLLALYYLPPGAPRPVPPGRRARDLLLAAAAGLGAAALALAVLTRPAASIADYFLAWARPLGGGANVVNVILVDFRGFDTLGEVTVLAIAAAGIHALLHGLRLPLPAADPHGRPWAADRHPPLLAALSRPLLPLALLVALFLLLRGHNAPGGGFSAALVAATALILQHLASGIDWTDARLRLDYFRLLGGGLLLAVATGLGAFAWGRPFLTSAWLHLELPLLGELELASALLFDLGVFLVVTGTVLLVLESLGRLSRPGAA